MTSALPQQWFPIALTLPFTIRALSEILQDPAPLFVPDSSPNVKACKDN
jgi:hypothetical protein